jgi:DNA-binding transcriptional ArsR family regulator
MRQALTKSGFGPILNLMVKYQETVLDRTFAALADPTRRALLARLDGTQGMSVSELAQPFSMSLPAIMKHLGVLSDAGLITRSKTGRTVECQLTAQPMEQAMQWLNRYQRFWSEQLDRLAAFVEEDPWPPHPAPLKNQLEISPRDPASPSNVVSMRRRRKSTPRGPIRKK